MGTNRSRGSARRAISASVAALALGFASPAVPSGARPAAGGPARIKIVKNPKTPIAPSPLSVREVATVPAPGCPPEALLARVRAIEVDERGWIFIADSKDQRAKVYDPEGRYVRAMGKVGQGPGEYQDLSDLLLTGRSEIALHDFQRQNLHYYDKEGKFLRSRQVPRKPNTGGGRGLRLDGQGGFFSLSQVLNVSTRGLWHEVALMGPDLSKDEILERVELRSDRNSPSPRLVLAARPGGGAVIGHPWEYRFMFYDSEGRLERDVSREFDPVTLSAEEAAFWFKANRYEGRLAHPIRDFVVDDKDRLIVQTNEWTRGRRERIFDVFDENGLFYARLHLPIRDYLRGDSWALVEPFQARNDKVYIVCEDEEANLLVKVFRFEWPAATKVVVD